MKTIIVIGAGIVGVSTAIWLQRSGFKVTIIDQKGPATGASHGNAGILAASSIIPVPNPSLIKKLPFFLLSKKSPVFFKMSYLPKMFPFLMSYLSKSNLREVNKYAERMTPLIFDTVCQHSSLAKGTGAEKFISYQDYLDFNGESGCRDNGNLRIEGRDYIVKDGDILHFRFNT